MQRFSFLVVFFPCAAALALFACGTVGGTGVLAEAPASETQALASVLGAIDVKPSWYFLPETCAQDAKWSMEGKALCRSRAVIYDSSFIPHPMLVAIEGVKYASKVLQTIGNRNNIIHPLRSIAADNAIPNGTPLYLPRFDGLKMVFDDLWIDHAGARKEGGRVIVHDGCFWKGDTGGAFRGKGGSRVDIYVGLQVNYKAFLGNGRYAALDRVQRGVWNHPKCAGAFRADF